MRRLWGCHARAALPSGSRSVGLGSSADGSWAERKAAEAARRGDGRTPARLDARYFHARAPVESHWCPNDGYV
jgi:hypothetical protein